MAVTDKLATQDRVQDGVNETAGDPVEVMKSHFLENSMIKSSGVREVSAAGFDAALLTQGVTKEQVKKVQAALDHSTTAATLIAGDDLVEKISASSKEDLASDDYRRGMSASVRLPTVGGKTEVSVSAETVNNIPFRGDGEKATKTTHGRIRVSINATGRIQKDLPGTLSDRIRSSLGLEPAEAK